ncbi:glutathione S-transferase family protein [Pararhizobium sp. BT-229]|uniref:glutathione S-transferase family protein n=1 Tax=Pararhizobium sp. BT-229 TaxID=2986923 RepID=UPI0021F69D49|nr:glutathione S-transferase family protein [Pararhizobium sp. BT-229]MCV9963229.1 glutathione S-transferase family protein [Pararhizobium sp. BT-229]
MQLFHAPRSCSLGIRILLEEIGVPYQIATINLSSGQQRDAAFLAVNPKGKVPALLRDDGTVLTEFPAIALWLAWRFPEAELLPDNPNAAARVIEAMEFIVGTVHMRGFALALMPGKFVSSPSAQEDLRAHGLSVASDGLRHVSTLLGKTAWLSGSRPGVADAALFYVTHWAATLNVDLPAPLRAFYDQMLERPSVRRAIDGSPT